MGEIRVGGRRMLCQHGRPVRAVEHPAGPGTIGAVTLVCDGCDAVTEDERLGWRYVAQRCADEAERERARALPPLFRHAAYMKLSRMAGDLLEARLDA